MNTSLHKVWNIHYIEYHDFYILRYQNILLSAFVDCISVLYIFVTKSVTEHAEVQIDYLSSSELNKTEIKLLEKGLKFTPTPSNSNTQELNKDILEFTRKVRLVEYFDGIEDDDQSLKQKQFCAASR